MDNDYVDQAAARFPDDRKIQQLVDKITAAGDELDDLMEEKDDAQAAVDDVRKRLRKARSHYGALIERLAGLLPENPNTQTIGGN